MTTPTRPPRSQAPRQGSDAWEAEPNGRVTKAWLVHSSRLASWLQGQGCPTNQVEDVLHDVFALLLERIAGLDDLQVGSVPGSGVAAPRC